MSVCFFSRFTCISHSLLPFSFFFFNDTATTEIYTLSLHDALPIYQGTVAAAETAAPRREVLHAARLDSLGRDHVPGRRVRSEEHTSELQSLAYLVCRLLLEKKKKRQAENDHTHDQTSSERTYSDYN